MTRINNDVPLNSNKTKLPWNRKSYYIPMRDGVLLAAFVYSPKYHCNLKHKSPLPVLWMHDRYHSACDRDNKGFDINSTLVEWLTIIIKNNYIVIIVDARGTGASYGKWSGPFSNEERLDAFDIMEWISTQSWCDGNLGMFGRSYRGITQYFAASIKHPNLKAVFPEMALFDLYSFAYNGGILRNDFAVNWGNNVKDLDSVCKTDKIDNDDNGTKLYNARKEHEKNHNVYNLFFSLPYRDSMFNDEKFYFSRNPSNYIKEIQESQTAFYHLGGWYDIWVKDTLLWYENLNNKQKIKIGPWTHEGLKPKELANLHLEWFDYWLKSKKNAIMEEKPISYYTIGAEKNNEWKFTDTWPLKNEIKKSYFLINQTNKYKKGLLTPNNNLKITQECIEYKVNYNFTSGKSTRWDCGYGGPFGYQDMSIFDNLTLTYISDEFKNSLEITGHVIINLWVQTDNNNADLFFYLEDITDDGYAQYITESNIRLAFYKQSKPFYKNFNLPYRNCYSNDIEILPTNRPINLIIDLLPISYILKKGHKLQLRISPCDIDNAMTPVLVPAPNIKIYTNNKYPSFINIPTIGND